MRTALPTAIKPKLILRLPSTPEATVNDADIVVTDTWVSNGFWQQDDVEALFGPFSSQPKNDVSCKTHCYFYALPASAPWRRGNRCGYGWSTICCV